MEVSLFSWRFSAQNLLDLTTSRPEDQKRSPETGRDRGLGRLGRALLGDPNAAYLRRFELLEQRDLSGMIELVLRNPAEHVVEGVIVLALARNLLLEA
jgi:hypothetical protein